MSDFISETTVKRVRKQHRCDVCPKPIEIGEPMVRWVGITDGDFGSCSYHPDCREAEVALNRMHGSHHDDWVELAELDWEDAPWLLETFPVVAERKGITADRIREHEERRARSHAFWTADAKRREELRKAELTAKGAPDGRAS